MPKSGDQTLRSTEGSRPGKRGRPPGSKNKAKTLLGRDLAIKLMDHMQDQLSPEMFEYVKGVVRDGKPIQTKNEIDILVALLTRNLLPAIMQEMMPEEEGGLGGTVYRKDVTDRLKLVREFLTLRNDIDKRESHDDEKSDTILTITGKRGIDLGRLGILIGPVTDSVGGESNGTGRQADSPRTLPDSVPERQEPVSNSQQGTADWVLDSTEYRDITQRDDEKQVQE